MPDTLSLISRATTNVFVIKVKLKSITLLLDWNKKKKIENNFLKTHLNLIICGFLRKLDRSSAKIIEEAAKKHFLNSSIYSLITRVGVTSHFGILKIRRVYRNM